MSTQEDIQKTQKLEDEYKGFSIKQITLLNMVEIEKVNKKVDLLMQKSANNDIKQAVFGTKLGFILTGIVIIVPIIITILVNMIIK